MENDLEELLLFITDWPDSSQECRDTFVELKEFMVGLEGTSLEFHARPGVSYSLRAVHENQTRQPLYAIVDVVEDEPRWLSVCFYSQVISDPEECGNVVPGGLLGEDGLCFDVEHVTEEQMHYVKERVVEAHAAASNESS